MTSQNKMAKTDRKNQPGRGGNWLKVGMKLRGISFFHASDRQRLKRELRKDMNNLEKEQNKNE
jgi:hypothetical protein